MRFFSFKGTLRTCLRKKAKAVLQFYPETAEDCYMLCRVARDVGFSGKSCPVKCSSLPSSLTRVSLTTLILGGLMVDFPKHMEGKSIISLFHLMGE